MTDEEKIRIRDAHWEDLLKLGYSEDEIDEFWDRCCEYEEPLAHFMGFSDSGPRLPFPKDGFGR